MRGLRSIVVASILILPLGFGAAAFAHTDFQESLPADGETVTTLVTQAVVRFTEPVTLAGAGFAVLDPDGIPTVPSVTTADEGATWIVMIDPPVWTGEVAVTYEVAAEDGHILTGGFSFVVDAPEPTPEDLLTTTTTVAASTTTMADDSSTPESVTSTTVGAAEPVEDGDGFPPAAGVAIAVGLVGGFGIYAAIRRSRGGAI